MTATSLLSRTQRLHSIACAAQQDAVGRPDQRKSCIRNGDSE
ncbi:hypothetical protein [Marinagarivorans cellulosilyticus]|nr:hypothetical protein [Marinagarivorans cellulosilyticus]